MLDKVLRIVILFDFYGSLLTDKQSLTLEMHYLNDFSLAEIADEFG
ncbi:MAG: putative transcriptional regulator with domain containing protein, partial [Firmicutes bacterium]|nr:putative transcriptional regulator with domain containing protein [Bacillota bacterium]